jgi:hypothetical protein
VEDRKTLLALLVAVVLLEALLLWRGGIIGWFVSGRHTPDEVRELVFDWRVLLSVTRPYDGNAATVGNGVMVALVVMTPEQVDAIHARAIELGGTDEGAPGPRGDSGFYAAYFRDLDGNKLNAFCMT